MHFGMLIKEKYMLFSSCFYISTSTNNLISMIFTALCLILTLNKRLLMWVSSTFHSTVWMKTLDSFSPQLLLSSNWLVHVVLTKPLLASLFPYKNTNNTNVCSLLCAKWWWAKELNGLTKKAEYVETCLLLHPASQQLLSAALKAFHIMLMWTIKCWLCISYD